MTNGGRLKSNGQGLGPAQPRARIWLARQIIGLVRQFGSTLIWAGVLVYFIHATSETLEAFAGQTSRANLIVSLSAHVNLTIALSVTLAGVATAIAALEYRRHRKTRERLTARITQLELILDPNRQSSMLTTQGTTREGDL